MKLKNLTTNFLARKCIFYEQIDSTQSQIWRLLQSGNIKNGTLVMANIQTSGKGTHGKMWYTDEKNNIAFSIFIKPNCKVNNLKGLTIKIAQIIVDILKEKYQIRVEIKAPNDIVYKTKKLGGILTETKLVAEQVRYLVIGIGINTNKQYFKNEIKEIATSIKKEFAIQIDSQEFIAEFCNRFEKYIEERIMN